MSVLLLTRLTFLEALRKRLFLAIVFLTLLLLVAYYLILHALVDKTITHPNPDSFAVQFSLLGNGIILSLPTMWLVYLITGVLVIFLASGVISSEIENGSFSIIVPKPL